MTYAESSEEIKKLLAEYSGTNPEDWYICLKARFAMELVFKALKRSLPSTRTEVITTPFTCITAINPILKAGYKPIYAPIDAEKLNFRSPEKYINEKTSAVVLQNTFGIVPAPPFFLARTKTSPLIIEDSAHSPSRMIKDHKDQVFADVSVHSFGVEKILPSKFGSAIYVNPKLKKSKPIFYKHLTSSLKRLRHPNLFLSLRIITYRFTNAIINRFPLKTRSPIRHFLSNIHLLESAVKPAELSGHQDNPCTSTAHANNDVLKYLKDLTKNFHQRTQVTSFLSANLKDSKKVSLFPIDSNSPLLVFPVLASSRKKADDLYQKLTSAGFYIRRWYNPPLYPGPAGPNIAKNVYFYDKERHPLAEEIGQRILCLPTDISKRRLEKLIDLLTE